VPEGRSPFCPFRTQDPRLPGLPCPRFPCHKQQYGNPPRPPPDNRTTGLKLCTLTPLGTDALRKYTKEHEWIDLSADLKTGVIGLSEYAAKELGDVVFVELPEEGKKVAAGDAIGAVESVKSAADINAPIACKITGINLLLEEKPATINQVPEDDSHGGGWIAKVQVTEEGVKDLEKLMDPQAYAEFTAAEGEH
jgi:glycine cleavage system H protein